MDDGATRIGKPNAVVDNLPALEVENDDLVEVLLPLVPDMDREGSGVAECVHMLVDD